MIFDFKKDSILKSNQFFQSDYGDKKKNIFFKTTKNPNLDNFNDKNNKIISELKRDLADDGNKIEGKSNNLVNYNCFFNKKINLPENYIHILISAIDKLKNEGLIEEIENFILLKENEIKENEEKTNSTIATNNNKNYDTAKENDKTNKFKIPKKCENKGCVKKNSKIKRKLYKIEKGTLNNSAIKYLCKQCLEALNKNQYCYYCSFIYHLSTNDKKSWVQCDYCGSWQHVICEEANGTYENILKNNVKGGFKYKCPLCRNCNNNNSIFKKITKKSYEINRFR